MTFQIDTVEALKLVLDTDRPRDEEDEVSSINYEKIMQALSRGFDEWDKWHGGGAVPYYKIVTMK